MNARSARSTRIYLDAPLIPGSAVELPSDAASHLAKVLRARSGDDLVLFNGDGREFVGSIESVRGSRVTARVGDGRPVDRESPIAVTLVQCLPRGDRMDFIVQKATELGVAGIVPVLSQHSVVRLRGEQLESKTAHWRAVAVSACEQCGRNRLPDITAPRKLIDYLAESAATGLRLVLEPGPEQKLTAVNPGGAVQIAVGPEGGFSLDELEALRISGFSHVTLGPRILRTETAAIAAVAWLQTRFGDIQGPWSPPTP
jgi:16S rRNA (uracil1498-N3)-methyltransferase